MARSIPIERTCCEYIDNRYGRFPATTGAFRTLLAYQSHQLEPDFDRRYYRPEAVNLPLKS